VAIIQHRLNLATYPVMASQKVANCCVAANYLVIAAYLCTPHSSKFARLGFDDFCLAISIDDFLRIHHP
jgi:hypothetical protein